MASWQAPRAGAALLTLPPPGFAGMKRQFPQPRDQAALGRKAGGVSDRLLVDLKKKTKQAERMLGNAASVSSSAKKKGREAELLAKDSAKVRAMGVTTSLPSGPVGGLSRKKCPFCRGPHRSAPIRVDHAERSALTEGSGAPGQ